MPTLAHIRPPHALLIEPIVRHALEEDLGRAGDITSEAHRSRGKNASAPRSSRASRALSPA